MTKRLILITAMVLAAITIGALMISAAATRPDAQHPSKMTDKELKAKIDSLVKEAKPLSADPLIGEAKKRARATQDTRWMMQLIGQDAQLNYARKSRQKASSDDYYAEELPEAWMPLRQLLHLKLFAGWTADSKHAYAALDDADELMKIKAADVLPENSILLVPDMSLYDFAAQIVLEGLPNSQHLTFDDIDELCKPLADFAASDREVTEPYATMRAVARKVLAQGNEQSVMMLQIARSCIHNQHPALHSRFAALIADIEHTPATSNYSKALKAFALANAKEYAATNRKMPMAEADSLIAEAENLFKEVENLVPKGSKLSHYAQNEILRMGEGEIDLELEDQAVPGAPLGMLLKYRNAEKAEVTIYPLGDNASAFYANKTANNPANVLKKIKPQQTLTMALPHTKARIHQSTCYAEAAPLKPGYYAVLAKIQGAEDKDSTLTVIHCSATEVNFVETAKQNYLVLSDMTDGTPITDATVGNLGKADRYGWVKWNGNTKGTTTISRHTVNGVDKLTFYNDDAGRRFSSGHATEKMTKCEIITDRRIYRPGQTVKFKTMVYTAYRERMEAAAGKNVTVRLMANNGSELFKKEFKTNDFGSIWGEIVVPEDAYKGYASLIVHPSKAPEAYASLLIEDFKRTDNKIVFDPQDDVVLPGQNVNVSGRVVAASGLPVANAIVKYEISCRSKQNMEPGTTTTDPDGRFSITFTALTAKELEEAAINRPRYYWQKDEEDTPDRLTETYNIGVSVTDSRGETTRDNRQCVVNSNGVEIGASAEIKNGVPTLTLTSNNSNGRPHANRLHVRIAPYENAPALVPCRLAESADTCLCAPLHAAAVPCSKRNTPQAGAVVWEQDIDVCGSTNINLNELTGPAIKLEPRKYAIEVSATAPSGAELTAKTDFLQVPDEGRGEHLAPLTTQMEQTAYAGDTLHIGAGSGMDNALITVFVIRRNEMVMRTTLECSRSMAKTAYCIPADSREGENLHVAFLCTRHGKNYSQTVDVIIHRRAENLKLELATKRDFSQPGAKETWTLKVDGLNKDTNGTVGTDGNRGNKMNGEIAASMYDSRLDSYTSNSWTVDFSTLSTSNLLRVNEIRAQEFGYRWNIRNYNGEWMLRGQADWKLTEMLRSLRQILETADGVIADNEVILSFGAAPGVAMRSSARKQGLPNMLKMAAFDSTAPIMTEAAAEEELELTAPAETAEVSGTNGDAGDNVAAETEAAAPRTNFAETVFFLPNLQPDSIGEATFSFTLPDNLTAYNFRAIVHDRQMRSATATSVLTTCKAINVRVGVPRFATEGDQIAISADVTVTDSTIAKADATLTLTDTETGRTLKTFENQSLTFAGSLSQRVVWNIMVPQGVETMRLLVSAKANAAKPDGTAQRVSDAEQHDLPVAKRFIEVPESHTFMLYKEGRHTIENPFERDGKKGETRSLTFSYTSNTFIEVLRALPQIDKSWYPSADTYLGRFETSAIARFLARKPEIQKAVEYLREHHETLHTIADAQNTPWLYMANRMRQHDKDLVRLMSGNYAARNEQKALNELKKMQLADGSFPWFKGMDGSPWMTASVVRTMGELVGLGLVDGNAPDVAGICRKALPYLDSQIKKERAEYEKELARLTKEQKAKGTQKEPTLYVGYSCLELMQARLLTDGHPTADIRFFADILEKHWHYGDFYTRVLSSNLLQRMGKTATAKSIIESVEENLVQRDDATAYVFAQGIYRASNQMAAQAQLILTLQRLNHKSPNLPKLINYMVCQKRGEAWRDNQTTSRCVLALLSVSARLDATDVVEVDGQKTTCTAERPQMTTIVNEKARSAKAVITKGNATPSWGSWSRVLLTPHDDMEADGTEELKVERQMEICRHANGKETWVPAAETTVRVGDQTRVTLKFYNDNALSNVRIRDHRAATMEPDDKLSGYRGWWFWHWTQADLPTPPHYMIIADQTTEFFIDHLAAGWHSISYKLTVTHEGDFAAGYADAQCMYEPDIEAHTNGGRLKCEAVR